MHMPRRPLHALIWSTDHTLYELFTRGQLVHRFRPGDDDLWRSWLGAHSAFVFQGHSGRINLHNEQRSRTTRYWYAYHATSQRAKRYLGKTANLTFERLEQVAGELSGAHLPAPRASHAPSPASGAQMRAASSDAARKAEQRMVLLATKLAPPRVGAALVVRERLLVQLDGALAHRLTLLSAAAGWGKTTLLATWLASRTEGRGERTELLTASLSPQSSALNTRAAWLSLDALDNDLTRFWVGIIAALRTCVPALGALALAMLHAPEPPPLSAILTALLNDLASVAQGAPLVLILDDYHLIDDQATHEALTFFLEHLPDQLHVVLASRVDPDLPLARWRVQGALLELRAADLRFSAAEASTFFSQALGEGLAEDDMLLLSARTEGWIAGLQLAALAMRQRENRSAFVRAFTGSQRYLLDYVQEEILERQPLRVQRFLLQTAVLRRLNAALCAALTEERASQALLEQLERNNLFVVPLDDERQWYRMHELFREVLLARLQASEPELVPLLHQRAAEWYAAQGDLREAIAHALAARDFAAAVNLIEREAGQLWLSGEAQTVLSWIGALPDVVVQQHARLALDTALRLLECLYATVGASFARTQTQGEQTIARVEALLHRQAEASARSEAAETLVALPEAEVVVLQRRIRLLRALIAARASLTRGDAEQMRLLAQETAELAKQEELSWKLIALSITFWLTEALQREGALLIGRLLEAKQQVIEAGDRLMTVRVRRWLAIAYWRAGRLRLVEQECLEALALLEQFGQHSAREGYLHYFLANTYYAWNRLEAAASSLQQVLRIAQAWQQADLLVVGDMFLAQLSLARGDLAAAEPALQRAEELVQQERLAAQAFWVVAVRVQYWLAAGDLDAASTWGEQLVFSSETWNPNRQGEFLMLIRVYLAQQQYTRALEALERFSAQLDRPGNFQTTIAFLALHAVALHYGGKGEQARAVAARLLALTESEGYIRVYLEEGEPMRQVLESLLGTMRDQENGLPPASVAFTRKVLAAWGKAESRQQTAERSRAEFPAFSSQLSALPEPLTRREQEILRLLVAGASNQEIATQLVISLATVKKHVSNLLGKLGVQSRTQAIARARDWFQLV
jgi:LuxR family maltose regulon positive regulatory protein